MNHFFSHSLPSTDSSKAAVSYWRKDVHIILVNCLGLSLSRKSVVYGLLTVSTLPQLFTGMLSNNT